MTLSLVEKGEKLANGVYKALTKTQKAEVRTARLKSAQAVQNRVLSAELLAEGFKLEKHELSNLPKGVTKYSLIAYKRPTPVAAAAPTVEELCAMLGLTVEQYLAAKAASK